MSSSSGLSEFVSDRDELLSKKTLEQLKSVSKEFHEWRNDRPLSDDLVARYIHVYVKGSDAFPRDFHGTHIEKHQASSTQTMLSLLRRDLRENHTFVPSDQIIKVIEEYLKARERKEPVKQAAVMNEDEIQKIIALKEDTPTELRDKLIFLIGTSMLGRSVEVASMKVEDITFTANGFSISIERRKTEKSGAHQDVFIPKNFFDYPLKEKLQQYMSYIPKTGPLWHKLTRGSHPKSTGPVADSTVREAVNRLSNRAKLTRHFTSHSMRRTGSTRLADAGCSIRQIQTMGNWKSPTVAERYVEHSMISVQGCATAITTPQEDIVLPHDSSDIHVACDSTAGVVSNTNSLSTAEPRSKVPRRCVYNFNAPVHNVYFVCSQKDAPQTEDWSWTDVFMNKQPDSLQ